MAQSITTLLNKTEITAAEIRAATNVLNYLYLVHGTGSRRSRKISLEELKKAIGDLIFDSLVVGDGTDYVQIADTKIKFNKAQNSFEISLTTATDGQTTIPVMYVNKRIQAAMGFAGNLVGDVTGNVTGDVTGDVTGNLNGDSLGEHTGNVKTNSILPRSNAVPIYIGDENQGAQFNGTLVAGHTIAGAVQATSLVLESGILVPDPQHPVDMTAGPIIKISSIADTTEPWSITSLKNVIIGQRITIANADSTRNLRIWHGRDDHKVVVIPPKSACDFVLVDVQVIGTAPNVNWVDTWAVVGCCEFEAWA